MNKSGQYLVMATVMLAAAVLASALMLKFSPGDSWLKFVGWVIFFTAIQSPTFLIFNSQNGNCTAWLSRLRKKN